MLFFKKTDRVFVLETGYFKDFVTGQILTTVKQENRAASSSRLVGQSCFITMYQAQEKNNFRL